MNRKLALFLLAAMHITACGDLGDRNGTISSSQENFEHKSDAGTEFYAGNDELSRIILSKKATPAEIKYIFMSPDIERLSNNINLLVLYRDNMQAISILRDVWELRREQYPDFEWMQLKNDRVRVALAQVLAQVDDLNFDEYYDFVYLHLDNNDPFTRAASAAAIGMIGNNQDIEIQKLREIIMSDEIFVAANAIAGLGMMRSEKARTALLELRENASVHPEKRRIITETLEYYY